MKISVKLLVMVLAGVLIGSDVSAQRRVVRRNLMGYLKQQYDTMLVYQPVDKGSVVSDYYFICRKNGNTTLFTYVNPFAKRLSGYHPPAILKKFVQEDLRFKSTVPDTNRYFQPYTAIDSLKRDSWAELMKLDVWQLQADDGGGDSCNVESYDGVREKFYFYAGEIRRTVSLYQARFFEEHCPGNANRKKGIAISEVFRKLFRI